MIIAHYLPSISALIAFAHALPMVEEWDLPPAKSWLSGFPSALRPTTSQRHRHGPWRKNAYNVNQRHGQTQSNDEQQKRRVNTLASSAPSRLTADPFSEIVDDDILLFSGPRSEGQSSHHEQEPLEDDDDEYVLQRSMQDAARLTQLYEEGSMEEVDQFIFDRMHSQHAKTMAMNYACVQGYFKLALLLIERHGADGRKLNQNSIDWARIYGDKEIFKQLAAYKNGD